MSSQNTGFAAPACRSALLFGNALILVAVMNMNTSIEYGIVGVVAIASVGYYRYSMGGDR